MLPTWDVRTFRTPEDHDERLGGPGQNWHDRGIEHRTWERGAESGIARRLEDRKAWVIDFDSLDDLLAFVDRYGSVVVSKGILASYAEIEIYDDYRE